MSTVDRPADTLTLITSLLADGWTSEVCTHCRDLRSATESTVFRPTLAACIDEWLRDASSPLVHQALWAIVVANDHSDPRLRSSVVALADRLLAAEAFPLTKLLTTSLLDHVYCVTPDEVERIRMLAVQSSIGEALLYKTQGRLHSAFREYRDALMVHPLIEVACDLAGVLGDLGRPDDALELLVPILNRLPDDPIVFFNLACAYFGKGDFQAATQYALTALEHRRDYAKAARLLAACYILEGERGRALDVLQSAMGAVDDASSQAELSGCMNVLQDSSDDIPFRYASFAAHFCTAGNEGAMTTAFLEHLSPSARVDESFLTELSSLVESIPRCPEGTLAGLLELCRRCDSNVGTLLGYTAALRHLQGHHDWKDALAIVDDGLRTARNLGPGQTEICGNFFRRAGLIFFFNARPALARPWLEEALQQFERGGHDNACAAVQCDLGLSSIFHIRVDDGVRLVNVGTERLTTAGCNEECATILSNAARFMLEIVPHRSDLIPTVRKWIDLASSCTTNQKRQVRLDAIGKVLSSIRPDGTEASLAQRRVRGSLYWRMSRLLGKRLTDDSDEDVNDILRSFDGAFRAASIHVSDSKWTSGHGDSNSPSWFVAIGHLLDSATTPLEVVRTFDLLQELKWRQLRDLATTLALTVDEPEEAVSFYQLVRSFGQVSQLCLVDLVPSVHGVFAFVLRPDHASLTLVKLSDGFDGLIEGVAAANAFLNADAEESEPKTHAELCEQFSAGISDLSRRLLQPLASEVRLCDTIVFCPGNYLSDIPFLALELDGRPLAFDKQVIEVPSLTVLEHVRHQTSPKTENLVMNTWRAPAGSPQYGDSEAREVANALQVTALLGGDATCEVLKQRLGQARIVHLSCHGFHHIERKAHEEYFGRPRMGLVLDDRFDFTELAQLDFSPDLVTLSSCSQATTSLGLELAGMSMATALLLSGARTVIAPKWPVSATMTCQFFGTYYHDVVRMRKSRAFQRAMRSSIETHSIRDWGALCYFGAVQ